jgi:hypothetical protein
MQLQHRTTAPPHEHAHAPRARKWALTVGWGVQAKYTQALPSAYQYFSDPTKGGALQLMDFCPYYQPFLVQARVAVCVCARVVCVCVVCGM